MRVVQCLWQWKLGSVTQTRQTAIFGQRKEPHTIIIARGNRIRHFTIRPWLGALVGAAVCAVAIGYLLATSYLVLRDDIIGATMARQARMQQAYEDRISALRGQVDRITSRQLLDQQVMERKVGELLERQSQLSERHGRMTPVLGRAQGKIEESPIPIPTPRPDLRAGFDSDGDGAASLAAYTAETITEVPWPIRQGEQESATDRTDRLFMAVGNSLRAIESEQLLRITSLMENTYQTVDTISTALESAGISVDEGYGTEAVGGPLVPDENGFVFETRVKALDEALGKLESLKTEATRLPLRNPAPGQKVTSGFGDRPDPLLKRTAHHSGMDFRARRGTTARATGAGKVVSAGWNGGYGRMVEIDHGDGFSTRYAHLSEIAVTRGQTVEAGAALGKTGSSGRSTGPHLHYEVRRDGNSVDPLGFIKAGREISRLM